MQSTPPTSNEADYLLKFAKLPHFPASKEADHLLVSHYPPKYMSVPPATFDLIVTPSRPKFGANHQTLSLASTRPTLCGVLVPARPPNSKNYQTTFQLPKSWLSAGTPATYEAAGPPDDFPARQSGFFVYGVVSVRDLMLLYRALSSYCPLCAQMIIATAATTAGGTATRQFPSSHRLWPSVYCVIKEAVSLLTLNLSP